MKNSAKNQSQTIFSGWVVYFKKNKTMRNHEKFIEMSLTEKLVAFGKLQHLYSTSPGMFKQLNKLIAMGERDGCFDDVTILPKPADDLCFKSWGSKHNVLWK